jgi:hypothetical protein
MVSKFLALADASNDARSSVHSTGTLDMNRLVFHRFDSDIFSRITKTRDGVNHGIYMLIDWSGSMTEHLQGIAEQVTILALFCRTVNIPFRISLFSDNANLSKSRNLPVYENPFVRSESIMETSHLPQHCTIIRILDSECSNKTFETSLAYFLCLCEFFKNLTGRQCVPSKSEIVNDFLWNSSFHMGGTPLNNAINIAIDDASNWVSSNHIDRPHFVLISDGADTSNGIRNFDIKTNSNQITYYKSEMESKKSYYNIRGTLMKNGHSELFRNHREIPLALIRLAKHTIPNLSTHCFYISSNLYYYARTLCGDKIADRFEANENVEDLFKNAMNIHARLGFNHSENNNSNIISWSKQYNDNEKFFYEIPNELNGSFDHAYMLHPYRRIADMTNPNLKFNQLANIRSQANVFLKTLAMAFAKR